MNNFEELEAIYQQAGFLGVKDISEDFFDRVENEPGKRLRIRTHFFAPVPDSTTKLSSCADYQLGLGRVIQCCFLRR